MKREREILAVGLSTVLLVSLLAFAQPVSAGEITLTGPERVNQPNAVSLNSLVEVHDKGAIDTYTIVISTEDGVAVNVSFAPNGTVLDVQPQQTESVDGALLNESLNITLTAESADRGAQTGYADDGTDTRQASMYLIDFDSEALAPGTYTIRMGANAGGESVFESNDVAVTVDGPE